MLRAALPKVETSACRLTGHSKKRQFDPTLEHLGRFVNWCVAHQEVEITDRQVIPKGVVASWRSRPSDGHCSRLTWLERFRLTCSKKSRTAFQLSWPMPEH